MQLSFDAADRLVELVQARRGPVAAEEAACRLFALATAPTAIARALLDEVVGGDARLAWRGSSVGLADPPGARTPLHEAGFVVVDLETTGLTPTTARICEIGAQRVQALGLGETFETLVDPGVPVPGAVTALTGIDRSLVRGAPTPALAVRRFLSFAGDDALVAHNARFDLAFLDREVESLTGRRIAAPVVDTVWLARRLLGDRLRRVSLASLAEFLGVPTTPCHRALPDARATAEILVVLLGLAQERGAETVADVVDLAAPRARRLHAKRALVAGAPTAPGIYVFRGKDDLPLYVGKARNLRVRLRSYLSGARQRPAVEAALAAVERVEWTVLGSELEAALMELRLLRELRPPANARGTRPDRHLYLRRRDARWSVVIEPTPLGPIRGGKRVATLAARALDGYEHDDPALALPRLRGRLAALARVQRFEDAARLRDRVRALDEVVEGLAELERLRALELCLLVPHGDPGFVRAFAVAGGGVAATRAIPRGPGALHEAAALIEDATVRCRDAAAVPTAVDELLLVGTFLRSPPPELTVVPLEVPAIADAAGIALAA